MPVALNRTDGMIWIDQNSPYRLKYHIHDADYAVETTITYPANVPSGQTFTAGTVVKLDAQGQITKAQFPMDINNVLGVILQSVTGGESEVPVAVGKVGSIILQPSEYANIFVTRDQSRLSTSQGAPVYWDCGYVNEDGSYIAPEAGKLTIQTPSGYKYHIDSWEDNQSLTGTRNIGYNNLPQIGNIIHTDSYMEINLNFSPFDATIEWYWPAIGAGVGQLSATNEGQSVTLNLHHGLFAPTKVAEGTEGTEVSVRCPCSISAHNDLDLELLGYFSHTFPNTGSYTTLTYNLPESLSQVYISGEVIYGFNKH